jgi:hypothetical protein
MCPRRNLVYKIPKNRTYRHGYGLVDAKQCYSQSTSSKVDLLPPAKKKKKEKRKVSLSGPEGLGEYGSGSEAVEDPHRAYEVVI